MSIRSLVTAASICFAVAAGLASPATADKIVWVEFFDDGETAIEYVNEEGDHYLVFYDEEMKAYDWTDIEGDPNPEDGSSGLGNTDKDALNARLKALGGAMERTPEFWLTPIGRDLAEGGVGGFTVTDPAPEYDPSAVGYDPEEGHGGNGGGWDPMAGSLKDNIRQSAGQSGNDNDDDDDSDPAPVHHGETFPGPPELVNPVPIARLNVRSVSVPPNVSVIGK